MADTTDRERDQRREEEDRAKGVPVGSVREDDLEPHEGLRYIAKLFKAMALLLIFMLIAELIIGFQQDGTAALGTLLVEATRLVVFAGFLWGIGDMAVMLIESNHDLRAVRILVGRLGTRFDSIAGTAAGTPGPAGPPPASGPVGAPGSPGSPGTTGAPPRPHVHPDPGARQ